MVIAKEGFETVFQNLTVEKQLLTAEKETALKVAYDEVNAKFAERESLLDEILAKVSVDCPEPEVEQPVAPELILHTDTVVRPTMPVEEDDILDY